MTFDAPQEEDEQLNKEVLDEDTRAVPETRSQYYRFGRDEYCTSSHHPQTVDGRFNSSDNCVEPQQPSGGFILFFFMPKESLVHVPSQSASRE